MADISYDTVLERVRDRFVHEPEIVQRLRDETARHPHAGMMLDPEGGALLAFLARVVNPKRTLDIGVFTGFSSLTVTLNAPEARVIALDVDADVTQIAMRYWEDAGVADRIDLRIGPALESLDQLIADGETGNFDFAFVDADKPGYPDYYERALELLRPGGVIVLDNVLWSVLDNTSESATILDDLVRRMSQDDRVTMAMLPLGSGMAVATRNT